MLYSEAKNALAALATAARVVSDYGAREIPPAPRRQPNLWRVRDVEPAGRLSSRGRPRTSRTRRQQFPGCAVGASPRRVDIGFVEGTDSLDGLETLLLFRDEIVAVVGIGHP